MLVCLTCAYRYITLRVHVSNVYVILPFDDIRHLLVQIKNINGFVFVCTQWACVQHCMSSSVLSKLHLLMPMPHTYGLTHVYSVDEKPG